MKKIRGIRSETVEVQISNYDALELAMDCIREEFDIPVDAYVEKKGNLVRTVEDRYGSHSSFSIEIIRVATDQDRYAIEVLNKLQSSNNKLIYGNKKTMTSNEVDSVDKHKLQVATQLHNAALSVLTHLQK